MSDGVELATDIYRPRLAGPHPVLLLRTPYGKALAQTIVYAHPVVYARAGYVVVIQDVRGRGASGGDWIPFQNEARDGFETVRWAARLAGTTGRVGMYGFSYGGLCQLLAATQEIPELACIAPAMTSADLYDGWTYRGGALQQAFVQSWVVAELAPGTARRMRLPAIAQGLDRLVGAMEAVYGRLPLNNFDELREVAPYYFDWISHKQADAYWARLSPGSALANLKVPALHISGWYDIFLEGTVRTFLSLKALPGVPSQRLVLGPWLHMPWSSVVGGEDLGRTARSDVDELQLRWFGRWLKNGARSDAQGQAAAGSFDPSVRIFITGANEWRAVEDWPPPGTCCELYLGSDFPANSLDGGGTLRAEPPIDDPPDVYVYDPAVPVRSIGGRSCCIAELAPMGPADQRPVEVSHAVLVYSSRELRADIEIIGSPSVTLFASTTGEDTDWTAKLIDVRPDGYALNIADGVIRASYRNSVAQPAPLTPGTVYKYDISLGPVGHRFAAGHRIRLEISSSSFPMYNRNLNVYRPGADLSLEDRLVATQTIYHDRSRPSCLRLPAPGSAKLTFT
jgi:putative CocE/NonD family hydrolase